MASDRDRSQQRAEKRRGDAADKRALSAGTGQSNTNVILRNVLKEDMFIIRRGFSGPLLSSLPLRGTLLRSLLQGRTQGWLARAPAASVREWPRVRSEIT